MTEPVVDTPEKEEQVDVFELSDEEFAKLNEPSVQSVTQEKEVELPSETSSDESTVGQEETGEVQKEAEVDPGTEVIQSDEKNADAPGSADDNPLIDDSTGKNSPEKKPGEPKKEETPADNQQSLVDYKTEYEKLMAPFKANGSDMQVKSVDDAIQLMKMGAGFHKKMAALKPNLRQMKLLEKHGLLDDEKLNYLIDLHNRDPKAIQKLLKESNIDPLDIDVKAETNYKPTDRKISDKELDLDNVLNEIRDTPTFQKTLNVVSNQWDESSQNTIASEPQIISIINGHIADGTFDVVMKRVDYERSLGRLSGVSDFEAYKQMGNALANEGVLQRVGASQQTVQSQPNVQPPKAESQEEIERQKKKRAASPTKGSKTTAAPAFDPLDMSDEDFAKLDINKYIKS